MSNDYQLYLQDVFTLAETLVIKSTETEERLNKYIQDYYGASAVDLSSPMSWKYYLNLAGEYHPTDDMMSVVSWDTLETINFTKETLALHRATFYAYQYGTPEYQELVAQYPKQEMLILGILNPVDMATAIAADDGTILAYPSALVESNEYSLITKLEAWIKGFKVRWYNPQYGLSDELYPATNLGIMYLNLVPAILSFRLEACKTNEAHSFHVRQYLLSHGIAESSIRHMTKPQALFFYRNIRYIHRNAGKRETFAWLTEHIMTERAIPLAEYTMRHTEVGQLENLVPNVQFHQHHLNDIYSAGKEDNIDLTAMLTKELPAARGNAAYIAEATDQMEVRFENSLSAVVMTKVLESTMIDYHDSGPTKLEDILLNHWLYLSVKNYYRAHVRVTDIKSGERFALTAKDAFIVMIYAFAKSIDIDLVTIPQIPALRVQRIPMASVETLMSVADTHYVDSSMAMEILKDQPLIAPMISTEAFNILCTRIYAAALAQRQLYMQQEHFYRRALVYGMVEQVYCDALCTLVEGEVNYADWFRERKLNFDTYTQLDFRTLYTNIVISSTGVNNQAEPTLKSLQAAMIRLMTRLSSYSIQFLSTINSGTLVDFGIPPVRLGDINTHVSSAFDVPEIAVDLMEVDTTARMTTDWDVTPVELEEVLHVHQHHVIDLPHRVTITPDLPPLRFQYFVDAASVQLNSFEVISH